MTKQELNRDIKRLFNKAQNALSNQTNDEYHKLTSGRDSEVGKEFKRLLYADKEFKYMNKQSVCMMLRMNVRYVYEPLHLFGIHIEI